MDPGQIARLRYQTQLLLERTCPATVFIGLDPYVAATRGLGSADTLTDQGFTYQFDIVFRIRKDLLPTPPAIGKTIRWQDVEYRIAKLPDRPTDPAWHFGCMSVNG